MGMILVVMSTMPVTLDGGNHNCKSCKVGIVSDRILIQRQKRGKHAFPLLLSYPPNGGLLLCACGGGGQVQHRQAHGRDDQGGATGVLPPPILPCHPKSKNISTQTNKGSFLAVDCELSGLGDRRKLNAPSIEERFKNTSLVAKTR